MYKNLENDQEIREQLRLEIDQTVNKANTIDITVQDGVVTLTGVAGNFADQIACEEVARNTPGVVAVVQNIQLTLPDCTREKDEEIAKRCKLAIQLNRHLPNDHLNVIVKDGCVILKGEVDSLDQRHEAEDTIYRIPGIRALTDEILVKPGLKAGEVRRAIQREFRHVVDHHAAAIQVEILDGTVILSGFARAWFEISFAEHAVRHLPGIKHVINNIELTPLLAGRESVPE